MSKVLSFLLEINGRGLIGPIPKASEAINFIVPCGIGYFVPVIGGEFTLPGGWKPPKNFSYSAVTVCGAQDADPTVFSTLSRPIRYLIRADLPPRLLGSSRFGSLR